MSDARLSSRPTIHNNRPTRLILALGVACTAIYVTLAFAGDLRERPALFFTGYALLLAAMWVAWTSLRGRTAGFRWMLGAALVFRVVAASGEPALSDDVHRYVWDGRVQLHGVHPFLHAPDDPELAPLRDEDWESINHRQLKTVYPPVSQMFFLVFAALGGDQVVFRLALGLVDFGVVLALGQLLRTLNLPKDRLILYAWNPLAVFETSGSGHVEPLGIGLVLLATVWIIDRRPGLSTAALAAAIHVKLAPITLIPAFFKRYPVGAMAGFVAWLVALWIPYAATGPAIGTGLWAYAGSWEYNSSIFAVVQQSLLALDTGNLLEPAISWLRDRTGADWIPWNSIYTWVWPETLSRAVVGALAVGWIIFLARRPGIDLTRTCFCVLAGVLILSPTVHPWYVLWVLPFAAVFLSRPWLIFSAVVVLAYLGGDGGPPLWVRLVEYGTLYGCLAYDLLRRRHTRYPLT